MTKLERVSVAQLAAGTVIYLDNLMRPGRLLTLGPSQLRSQAARERAVKARVTAVRKRGWLADIDTTAGELRRIPTQTMVAIVPPEEAPYECVHCDSPAVLECGNRDADGVMWFQRYCAQHKHHAHTYTWEHIETDPARFYRPAGQRGA